MHCSICNECAKIAGIYKKQGKEMKRKLQMIFCAILMISFLALAYAIAQRKRSAQDSDTGELITVLNPAVANKMAERLPLAPRLDTLNGKTIYMVDINWGGPEAALNVFEEMQAWFARTMPDVKTIIKMKKGGYDADDPDLWREIREKGGNAAILGVSG
jgi:hypothetical protein